MPGGESPGGVGERADRSGEPPREREREREREQRASQPRQTEADEKRPPLGERKLRAAEDDDLADRAGSRDVDERAAVDLDRALAGAGGGIRASTARARTGLARRGVRNPTRYTWSPVRAARGSPERSATALSAWFSSWVIRWVAIRWRTSTTATPTVSAQDAIAAAAR